MMSLFAIALEARAPSKKSPRAYGLAVGRGLLGDWVVELRHGRIGTRDQIRTIACVSESAARTEIRQRLKRRHSAPRRIGVSYRIDRRRCVASPTPSDAPEMKE